MNETDHLYLRAAYFAMVDLIDEQIGRIIQALEKSGQLDNTIIIFMSKWQCDPIFGIHCLFSCAVIVSFLEYAYKTTNIEQYITAFNKIGIVVNIIQALHQQTYEGVFQAMKLTWNKAVSLVLSLSMLLVLLAGCSGGNNSGNAENTGNTGESAGQNESANGEDAAEPTNITFWVLFDGADADTARKIVDEYNKLDPNQQVTIEFQENAQYYTKLKTSILGGTGPDLAMSHVGGNINGMVNDKILIPLDDEAKRLGVEIAFDKYSADPTKAANIDGKQYSVPLDNLVRVLMYNKQILKDAGLVDDSGKLNFEMSLAGFTAALQKLKETNPDRAQLAITMKPPQLVLTWLSFYYQLGGTQFLNVADKKASFDDAKAAEALKTLHELYKNYVPAKLTDPAGLDMFKASQSAFFIDGAWSINSAAQALGDNFGVAGFPYLFDNKVEVTTSHGFILPINDKRTDAETKAALNFIKWFGENNWRWAEAGHIPAFGPALETEQFKNLPYHPQFAEAGREVVALEVIPGIMLHTAPEVKDPIQLAVFGDISPEEAVQTVRKNLDQLIPQLVK